MNTPHIVVAGAGSIGCFTGGLLADAGHRVTLLTRPAIADAIRANGLRLTDLGGLDAAIPADRIGLATDPSILAEADLILVTVKGGGTATIAEDIATHARANVPVISLQNGVRNPHVLRASLPEADIRPGMVFFNVVQQSPGHYHRAIGGPVTIGDGPGALEAVLNVPGLEVAASPEIEAIQWGKLLFNLNNAPFALSGLTVLEHFEDRTWRCLMADQMKEALTAMKAAGIKPVMSINAPAWILPTVLRLPTFLFRRVAAALLQVDPEARPSMWQDLQSGRMTEVEDFQGAIVELAARHGLGAPLTDRIRQLVHQAETAAQGSPGLSVAQIRG